MIEYTLILINYSKIVRNKIESFKNFFIKHPPKRNVIIAYKFLLNDCDILNKYTGHLLHLCELCDDDLMGKLLLTAFEEIFEPIDEIINTIFNLRPIIAEEYKKN